MVAIILYCIFEIKGRPKVEWQLPGIGEVVINTVSYI